jgi:formylglycine-generating enzyme required for sulfatase activity
MHTIRVPTGSFLMGSTDAEVDRALQLCEEAYGDCQREWFEDEQPAHEVTLDAFHIDQTEVTNGQFAAFLNAQKDEAEGDLTWGGVMLDLGSEHCLIEQVEGQFRPEEGYADHPAITVSWYGAKAYCAWVGAPASHRGGMGVRCSRDRSASLSLGRHLRRVALELLRRE